MEDSMGISGLDAENLENPKSQQINGPMTKFGPTRTASSMRPMEHQRSDTPTIGIFAQHVWQKPKRNSGFLWIICSLHFGAYGRLFDIDGMGLVVINPMCFVGMMPKNMVSPCPLLIYGAFLCSLQRMKPREVPHNQAAKILIRPLQSSIARKSPND